VTNQNERRSSGGELVTDCELDRYIEEEEEEWNNETPASHPAPAPNK